MRSLVLLALVGCGRISFDPARDGAINDGPKADVSGDTANSDLLFEVSFDNGILDDARGHTVGCINGCPALTAGHVGAGSAIFNTTECIAIADASDLHPVTYTFAVWAAIPVPSQNSELIARPLDGATMSGDTFEIWVQPDSGVVTAANGVQTLKTGLDVTLWHHYAGVFDGSSLISYIDGAVVGTMAGAGTSMYGPDPYLLGCDRDNGAEIALLNGSLDDARLYGRVLDPAEIAALAGL